MNQEEPSMEQLINENSEELKIGRSIVSTNRTLPTDAPKLKSKMDLSVIKKECPYKIKSVVDY